MYVVKSEICDDTKNAWNFKNQLIGKQTPRNTVLQNGSGVTNRHETGTRRRGKNNSSPGEERRTGAEKNLVV